MKNTFLGHAVNNHQDSGKPLDAGNCSIKSILIECHGCPGPVKVAASRKDDDKRVCCERTVRRSSCSPCACWAKRSRDVVTPVFCCNRSDLPLGGHVSPGDRDYGGFIARVDTLGRIHGGLSAVNQRETSKSARRDPLEAEVELPTREGIDG